MKTFLKKHGEWLGVVVILIAMIIWTWAAAGAEEKAAIWIVLFIDLAIIVSGLVYYFKYKEK